MRDDPKADAKKGLYQDDPKKADAAAFLQLKDDPKADAKKGLYQDDPKKADAAAFWILIESFW